MVDFTTASIWDGLLAALWPARGPRLCNDCGGPKTYMVNEGGGGDWHCLPCNNRRFDAIYRRMRTGFCKSGVQRG